MWSKVMLSILIVLITMGFSSATAIHAKMSTSGVGYVIGDTTLDTNIGFTGHEANIAERGSGTLRDNIRLEVDTLSQSLSVHTVLLREYSPVIYNDEQYDRTWRFGVLSKNYEVGSAVVSEYKDAQKIDQASDWILNVNLTHVLEKTTYLGKNHFGMRVVNPENPRHVIMDSYRDTVGLFSEEREIIVANNTSPHSIPLSCP